MGNPYLALYHKHQLGEWSPRGAMSFVATGGTPLQLQRFSLCNTYAWAIPSQAAIEQLVALSPIVEIGAGTGYWASLVADAGGDIICYDNRSWSKLSQSGGAMHHGAYHPVAYGTGAYAGRHPDRTLFLCWPPYKTEMAYRALARYLAAGGRRVVYVGESDGGCTGDERFHRELRRLKLERELALPQWAGIHDVMCVYRRLEPSP